MEKKGIKVVKEDIQAAEFEWIKVGHKLPSVGARGAYRRTLGTEPHLVFSVGDCSDGYRVRDENCSP